MDYLAQLHTTANRVIYIAMLVSNGLVVAIWYVVETLLTPPLWFMLPVLVATGALTPLLASRIVSNFLLQPVKALWQAILHVSPNIHNVPSPQIESLRFGQELVANLTSQVYQLASVSGHTSTAQSTSRPNSFVETNLPLPLFILNEQQLITFANQAAGAYLGLPADELTGKNVYMVLDMAFPNHDTLDAWLKEAKASSATAARSWERVRLNVLDNRPTRLFDLAAYYNRDNPNGQETLLVLFDHTKQYSQDEQAVSFVALTVHELRTPLTLLRGYIEAFQEELGDKLDPQMTDFMAKMSATAQQLTAFVNNILNVARVDDDQLELRLQQEQWDQIIASALSNLELRARVRGIQLTANVAPGLPIVGVDRLSIYEVLNNLVDNAIKYSGDSKQIVIDAHLTQDGLVETTVTDSGVGIGPAIIPNLFTKFYRDHHNRAQVGGTGLGLYLCKAIVTAHGGQIWVRSKPGIGSTFGFTVQPYERLAAEVKNGDNSDIVRGAHGWIKNHSLYRR